MKLSITLKRILGGAALVAALALGVSAALPGVASAHGGPGGFGGFKGGDKAGMLGQRGGDDTYLADALAITTAELQAAHEAAAEAALDQAVTDGLITQAQADAIRERGLRFDGRMLGRFDFGNSAIDMEALLAAELGISVDDLQAAHETAQEARIAEAVANGDLTQEQADEMQAMRDLKTYLDDSGLQESIRSLRQQAIQGAVDAGVITQEQADQILQNQNGFGLRGQRGRFDGRSMPDFGGRGGHGLRGGHGMRGFNGQNITPNGASTVAATAFSL